MPAGPRLSLRLRITAGALLVVVAVAAAGGLLFIRVVEHELVDEVDSTLTANADFIDGSLRSGSPLPTGRGPADLLVQFLAPDGTVAGASTAAQGVPPLAAPVVDGGRHIEGVHRGGLGDLRVLTEPSPVDERTTIVVARSAESVADVRSLLARVLIASVAAGSVLLAVLIWVVVGRALRPVESMRRTAQAISERNLDLRLDRPRTSDELQRLADTLNELLDRLERAVAGERRFVADASHELRSPIAGIRALLETEPADPAQVVEVRAEALARLARLEDLVERLLVLARNEAPVRAPARLVDLDDLVLGQARQLGRTTNLHIDTADVSGGQVLGDDADLGRVVENLAVNAARHARSSVAFSLHEVDGVVELAVTDDGPGIAAVDRLRVFDRFTTLDDARALPDGRTGLGLSIASAIVSGHGGSIHAEEGPGAGARMVVRLPVAATPLTVDVPT